MASGDPSPDPNSWTVPQLKSWLRDNFKTVVRSGTRLELLERVLSLSAKKEVEEQLNAEEKRVPTLPSVDFGILPPKRNPGWVSCSDECPHLAVDIVQSYLRPFGGYTKNWKSGCQLSEDGHVFDIQYHRGLDDGIQLCKGRCKPTMSSVPTFYESFAVFEVGGPNVFESVESAGCLCKAGQSQSCKYIAALLIMYSYLSEPSCTSKACSWLTPGNRPSEFSLGTGLDFGKVQKREDWTGMILDVEDLQKSLVDGQLNTAWTAFKEIEMQKLRLLHQSEASAVLPICIDPMEKISRLTANKRLDIITADYIISCLTITECERDH